MNEAQRAPIEVEMYECYSQTSVRVPNLSALRERLDILGVVLRFSTTHRGRETSLKFDGGQAILKSSDKDLFLWVAAENILLLFGIQTVLEANILEVSIDLSRATTPPAIFWSSAEATPFS
ncbi:SMa0974 family conjugal transfer regulator [Rhizobium giardinii]|uniref:SMa0974 family conjugal transfer regulator n=1 Tax=Rhizobium giardinii TaxID=56731 RepID=UPI003D6F7EAC